MTVSKLVGLASAAAFLASAVCAQAADMPTTYEPVAPAAVPSLSGFYLGTITAATWLDDTDFSVLGTSISSDYEVGYYTGLRVGYNFGPMFSVVSPRVELEGGLGSASVDTHTVGGATFPSIDSFGDARTYQGFVNAYFDIGLGGFTAVTPYVGGGVGFANVDLRKQGVSATGVVLDDDDTAFAYHLDAGVAVNLGSLGIGSSLFEGTTMEVGYRYTNASDLTFTARDGTEADTDYTTNAVTVGFRKQF